MTKFRMLVFVTVLVITGFANAQHTSWYVDNALAGGNDDGASWANAWRSFAAINWTNVQPGDTIYVSGGSTSQTYTELVSIGKSGTSSMPITITLDATSANHNGTVIFNYNLCGNSCVSTGITLNQNYLVLSGNVGGANHIQVNNIHNTTNSRSSVGIGGSDNTGVVIDHVTFINDNNPLRFDYANGVTVHDCTITQLIGDAGIAMNASTGSFGNNLIHSNYIEPNMNAPVGGPDGIQGGSGISIYNNTIKEVINVGITKSQQHPDMMQIQGNYIKVYGNDFVNAGDSTFDFDCWANSKPHDIWVYNNIFRMTAVSGDGYPEAFRMYCSSGTLSSITNVKILNNDFIDSGLDYYLIRFDSFNGNPTGVGNEVKNNIFYNVGGGAGSPILHIDNSTAFTSSSFAFNSNAYYQSGQTQYISYRGTSYAAANWIAANEPKGKSGQAPIFKSYTAFAEGNDYHLSESDSVARQAGLVLSAYFTTDKDGVTRPQGSGWDIGAYEFATGVPPAPPTGLTATVR
jgi:hypothetical protein